LTTQPADFAFRNTERFGDQLFQGAISFIVLGRRAYARLEVRLAVCVARTGFDAVGAAGGRQANRYPAQLSSVRLPVSIPSSQ
jgi:hypothetical protein